MGSLRPGLNGRNGQIAGNAAGNAAANAAAAMAYLRDFDFFRAYGRPATEAPQFFFSEEKFAGRSPAKFSE